jgi:hypothetical protein
LAIKQSANITDDKDYNFTQLIKKLKNANPKRWNFEKEVHKIDLNKNEFRSIYTDKKANTIFNVTVYEEYRKYIFLYYINKYPESAKEVLEKSKFDDFKMYLIEEGYINDVKVFNKLAKSKLLKVRLFAVKYCDFKTLNKMAKDKDRRVRLKVFERLGPVESLDRMLEDKSWEVRLMGVRSSPFGYEKLSKMVGELSKQVFIELAKKIESDSIPMMLGNRNFKNKEAKCILQERLDGEQPPVTDRRVLNATS